MDFGVLVIALRQAMLNPTVTRGVIGSITMVTILGIATTKPSKASCPQLPKKLLQKCCSCPS